ncbi:hypothetical protein [Acetobacter sp. AN02]|uniref:hypothetical protein n=1 Tax=Acetobacter sp. AN02 TaxID=2894186 RepID=UPI00243430B6|nr:hypothetical protein [Acetobacter sp. AN02]
MPDREEILAKWRSGTLVDALFAEYGRIWLDEESPTIELLVVLHNSGEIDLLNIITTESVERHKGPDFFDGQHLYERLIPRITGSVREMVRVVETIRVGAGNDMAAGLHIDKFVKWCGDDPARPGELLALIDEGFVQADGYLIIAIKTGVAVDRPLFVDRAYGFLESGTERQRWGALSALGQIEMLNEAYWDRLLEAFDTALTENPDDTFLAYFLSAIGERLKDIPAKRIDALENLAGLALAAGGEHTLHSASRLLAFDPTPLSAALKNSMLERLREVDAGNNEAIDLLDIALSKMVKAGQVLEVRQLAEALVRRDEGAVKLGRLDSTVRAVIEDSNDALADWVVAWLYDGDHRLCSAMDRAMFGAGRDERPLHVDFSQYGLSEAEYPYLARKVVGSFFLKPVLMSSLLSSLLRSAPEAVSAEVEEVLVCPVLQNYAGSTRDLLIPISEDATDTAAPAVARAIAAQDSYLERLKAPGSVPELRPSERERQLEWERHTDSMLEAMRKARKKSIFAQIATESIILYGERAVIWVENLEDEPRRMETAMGSISTSFEVPRIEVVDPVGLQLMLLSFRAEPRPE